MKKEKRKDSFQITIDASACTSLIEGCKYFGERYGVDYWRYSNQQFESGKIYGLISEHQQGCMYLSYLLGGKIDFNDLIISWNGKRIRREDLERTSWNLEPVQEFYRNNEKSDCFRNQEKQVRHLLCRDTGAVFLNVRAGGPKIHSSRQGAVAGECSSGIYGK